MGRLCFMSDRPSGFLYKNLKQAPDYSGVGTELAHHLKHEQVVLTIKNLKK